MKMASRMGPFDTAKSVWRKAASSKRTTDPTMSAEWTQ